MLTNDAPHIVHFQNTDPYEPKNRKGRDKLRKSFSLRTGRFLKVTTRQMVNRRSPAVNAKEAQKALSVESLNMQKPKAVTAASRCVIEFPLHALSRLQVCG